ncbi:pre-mRNA-splicing factor CWC22 homolog [Cimex lectularius]|uniref:MI domain-containing protein n=1 Tax=Cimex lectularius TaxID=79782 RepID=A0A8I6S5T2_CIMLE|nr:pre-mRNA-splicing factor CWC22 homolog [Cimex lectularius]
MDAEQVKTEKKEKSESDNKEKRKECRKRPHSPKRRERDEGKRRERDEESSHSRRKHENGRERRDRRERRPRERHYDMDDYRPRRRDDDRRDRRDDNFKRYWGDKDKKVDETEPEIERNYLVGSRYYAENPAREKKMASSSGEDKENKSTEKPVNPSTLMTKTGGAYIPPGKLRLMQANITDKSSAEYQRIAWEALKKSIHGHINKVNTSNIGIVARLLFKENIIRGRGLLTRSIIQAQAASPTFTNVYASLVAIINSKFPNIGELLLKRVVIRFKRAYKRNDKTVCLTSSTFIAHLINQRVAHEILGLELLTLLVENPTDDSVEVAVSFLKEAGQKLSEVTSKGSNAIFDMLRNILHEGKLDKRIQYMIEVMFQVRKDEFQSFPAIIEELDLVDEEDQFTHLISLEDTMDQQEMLNVFKLDNDYEMNEDKYKSLRSEILDSDGESSYDDGEDDSSENSDDEDDDDNDDDDDQGEKKMTILDNTETNLIALRKTIYLTIQSSLDFEECAHKLLKMEIKPGQEQELCHMFLDCCAEQRTYEKFFGLLAQRFCQVNQIYVAPFEQIFSNSYSTVHRLDTNKLRNVAKFFAHLLFTDAISWAVLSFIKLNEEDTTSSSRIFIKILFQELSEYLGLANLNTRLKDPSLQSSMEGLFPRDNPKNTRFAINFFTSIGLGGLTDELREHLKSQPKPVPVSQLVQEISSSSSSSSSDLDSSSDSSSSESEEEVKKKKKKKPSKSKSKESAKKKTTKTKKQVKKKDKKQKKKKKD